MRLWPIQRMTGLVRIHVRRVHAVLHHAIHVRRDLVLRARHLLHVLLLLDVSFARRLERRLPANIGKFTRRRRVRLLDSAAHNAHNHQRKQDTANNQHADGTTLKIASLIRHIIVASVVVRVMTVAMIIRIMIVIRVTVMVAVVVQQHILTARVIVMRARPCIRRHGALVVVAIAAVHDAARVRRRRKHTCVREINVRPAMHRI